MRVVLKLLFYAAAIATLRWLLPQIATSLNRATEAASTGDASRGYALFSIYLIIGTVLATVLAWDIARFLGELAGRLFFGGGRVSGFTPALWKADRLRKEDPHGAIQVLRDYLATHPRQWRIALRIADIYQHDLKEPLAAALEYAEILKQRLPGLARADIMLRLAACQLLVRDGDQCMATLHEVIEQFPETPAAGKAARRLARMKSGADRAG